MNEPDWAEMVETLLAGETVRLPVILSAEDLGMSPEQWRAWMIEEGRWGRMP